MTAPRAVIFDLGGTLISWPDWDGGAPAKWSAAYDAVSTRVAGIDRDSFVNAMRGAEARHWQRVDRDHWSGPPTGVVSDGYRALDVHADDVLLLATMDAYARAVAGWSTVFPDSAPTLRMLRDRGYRLGLLSNTWWAAEWHNADLAAHGLEHLLDEVTYTSDLPHSKPHLSVFLEIARRLEVPPEACVMIGDRQIDDVSGARAAGMRGVWRRNESAFPTWDGEPDAIVDTLSELPALLRGWGGR